MGDEVGSIFRNDALEHRAKRTERGDVLRAAPPWTTGAFYLLIGIFIAGIVLASTLRIDRVVVGRTAVDYPGKVLVLDLVGPSSDILAGQQVQFGDVTAEVVSFDGSVVVTSATGDLGAGATARIIVGSDPVITLVPGLRALFGGGDA